MSLANAYLALHGALDADVSRHERLAHRTSYRIGGPAALLAVCHTPAALARVLDVLGAQGVAWAVMGKGSDVLVADAGFDGCVIVLGREFSRVRVDVDDATVTAGAAALLSRVVSQAMRASLTGLEFACGIPGTLGGAVSTDAGTRREWLGARVESVVTLLPGGDMRRRRGSEIAWGYRTCDLEPTEVVLEVTLALAPGREAAIAHDVETRLARRRAAQPIGKPCCGPVFLDPASDRDAAQLLAEAGMSGHAVGGAQVSRRHANFVVNNGTATASDVLAVMRDMHDGVRGVSGVDLQPEVKFLGFSS